MKRRGSIQTIRCGRRDGSRKLRRRMISLRRWSPTGLWTATTSEKFSRATLQVRSRAASAIFRRRAASAREAKRGLPGSMDDPKWRRGYALLEKHGFSADIQSPWWDADALCELAADFPKTQIIVVHTGLPHDRSAEGLEGWRKAMEKAAAFPNVAIKLSGLGQPGLRWSFEANGADHPRCDQNFRREAAVCSQAIFRSTASSAHSMKFTTASAARWRTCRSASRKNFPRQRRADLSAVAAERFLQRQCIRGGESSAVLSNTHQTRAPSSRRAMISCAIRSRSPVE